MIPVNPIVDSIPSSIPLPPISAVTTGMYGSQRGNGGFAATLAAAQSSSTTSSTSAASMPTSQGAMADRMSPSVLPKEASISNRQPNNRQTNGDTKKTAASVAASATTGLTTPDAMVESLLTAIAPQPMPLANQDGVVTGPSAEVSTAEGSPGNVTSSATASETLLSLAGDFPSRNISQADCGQSRNTASSNTSTSADIQDVAATFRAFSADAGKKVSGVDTLQDVSPTNPGTGLAKEMLSGRAKLAGQTDQLFLGASYSGEDVSATGGITAAGLADADAIPLDPTAQSSEATLKFPGLAFEPALVANSTQRADSALASAQSVALNVQSDAGSAVATDPSTIEPQQGALEAAMGSTDPWNAIPLAPLASVTDPDASAPTAPAVNPPKQGASVGAVSSFATSKTNAEKSTGSGRGINPQFDLSSATSSPGPSLSNGSPAAEQTPSAVYFASSGTESAATILPKIIVPFAGNVRGPVSLGGDVFLHGSGHSTMQNAATQNASAQGVVLHGNTDSSSVGSGTESFAVGSVRKETDTDANLPMGVSASCAAPLSPAPPTVATVVSQTGGVAFLPESLPKAESAQSTNAANAQLAPPPVPQEPALAQPGPVQVAQMVNRIGQAEMRIGMNTSAFGSVEVRTVVHASDVGLTIGSEKGDLRGLLTNEMSAITTVLQQQNLKLNSLNFMQGSGFSNDGSAGGNPHQQRAFVPSSATATSERSSGVLADDPAEPPPMRQFRGGANNLSILA